MLERKGFTPQYVLIGFIVLAVLLPLSGCGPIYDTRYSYSPPHDPQGQSCIFQCENMKMQCEQLEMMKAENCNNRNRIEQDRCRDNIRRQGREPKSSECSFYASCTTDTERCDAQYRICYQNCGGKVYSEEVCVFNCP